MSVEQRRLTQALLLSLLIHTLLLSLIFGGQGHWLPGFGFPWQERRIEAPDLRVVVVPAQVTAAEPEVTPVAEPLQQAWVEQSVSSGPALTPSVSRAPTPRQTATASMPEANPRTDAETGAAPAQIPLRADRQGDAAPPTVPAPAVIALAQTDEATWVVPATPATPAPVIAAAPSASSPETAMPSLGDTVDAARTRIDQEPQERGVELAKLDPSKQEEQRQAAQLEAARQEAALLDAARQVADLQEAARQVAARQEAALLDASRQAADLQEAARQGRPHVSRPHGRDRTGRSRTGRSRTGRSRTGRSRTGRSRTGRDRTGRCRTGRGRTGRGRTGRSRTCRSRTCRGRTGRGRACRGRTGRRRAGGGRKTGSDPSGDRTTARRGGRPA